MLPRPPSCPSETACPAASVRSPDSSREHRVTIERTPPNPPLPPPPIPGLPPSYETVPPPAPHRYSAPHSFRCLGCFLSPTTPTRRRHYRGEAFPRSTPAPEPSSRHLYAGHHQGSRQVSPWLIPGQQLDPVSMSSIR